MNNDPAAHVKAAKQLTSALSSLFFKGHHTAISGAYLVFVGFDAEQAAALLVKDAKGKIILIPKFGLEDGKVALQKVLVLDGICSPSQIVYMICDFIRYPDGSFGVMSDLKGHTVELRCINATQLLRRALRRPRNAAKLIERGRIALAEQVKASLSMAA